MSSPTRKKTLRNKSEKSKNLVDDFFRNKDDSSEPPTKKMKTKKKQTEDDPDDSINLFKSLRVAKVRSKPETSQTKSSTSNLATNFIDESSKKSSQSTSIRSRSKATNKTAKRKPKAQPDIRKVLSKQEQMFNHIVTENCLKEGLDPEEMQIAMAISESLKDQNLPPSNVEPSTSTSSSTLKKFENPFASIGKVLPLSSMLERFGFKSKKNYSEYEIDMMINSKISKRSKFQKFPTALTRMSNEKREEIIRNKIDRLLQLNQSMCLVDFDDEPRYDFNVFSYSLQEVQERVKTVFAISSEDRPTDDVLLSYYVTDLFEPSFVKADHLLKDWSKIQGRDPTPERVISEVSEKSENDGTTSQVIDEAIVISSSEIVETCNAEREIDPGNVSEGSCQDIFADIEDFDIDSYGFETAEDKKDENTCELAGNLSLLRDKFSQSVMEVGEEKELEINAGSEETVINIQSCDGLLAGIKHVDLTLQDSSDGVDEVKEHNFVEKVDLTQYEEPMEGDDNFDLAQTEESDQECENILGLVEEVHKIVETSSESEVTIPFDDSYYSLQQHMKKFRSFRELEVSVKSPLPVISMKEVAEENVQTDSHLKEEDNQVKINLVSSDEEATQVSQPTELDQEKENDSHESDMEVENSQVASQDSFNDDECIEISDEEVNYSMRKFQDLKENPSDLSSEAGSSTHETVDLTQEVFESDLIEPYPIEVNNFADESLVDVMIVEENDNINDTISDLLQKSTITYTPIASNKDRSLRINESSVFSDSIQDIMNRYGLTNEAKKETPRSFKKMQSDSQLLHKTVRFSIEDEDDIVDLTQQLLNDDSLKENSFQNNNFDASIHRSLENIMSNSPQMSVVHRKQFSQPIARKRSLGVDIDNDYIVDTETAIPESDFKNMTPVELKKELSKYGIRSLPVKKAIALLEHIYNQIYPEIRVAADEEIDMNDTRRVMNITDIVTNIEMQEDDNFVFQLGLVEDEDLVLPKMKKSKTHSCAIPLHISFYNMVRSNEKIQKFILEFRPVELDQIYKHFRKFGLSYELNDIISFLDRRCITFKTKEKSYSKTHERKKKKRGQKATQSQN